MSTESVRLDSTFSIIDGLLGFSAEIGLSGLNGVDERMVAVGSI